MVMPVQKHRALMFAFDLLSSCHNRCESGSIVGSFSFHATPLESAAWRPSNVARVEPRLNQVSRLF
jgi:hypothetical protein